jgi:hypothetical protein
MRIAVALASLALASLTACGGSSDSGTGPSGGSNSAIVGSYTLKLVDSKALPGTFADSSLESGTLVVTDSGWTQTTVVKYRVGGSGNPNGDTLSLGGNWAVTGSNVTLFDAGSTMYTGTFTSTSVTLTTKTATVLGYSK